MNPGDVVYLKSGGPAMTVKKLEVRSHTPGVQSADVSWFADKGTLCSGTFPVSCLTSESPRVAWTAE